MSLPPYLTSDRRHLERVARRASQSVHLGERTLLCRVLGKYIMYVDAGDIALTPHLCLDGFWESWITIAIARLLRPGWYCVDIGANCGYYTVLMADAVGESGRVLAIEPNDDVAGRLSDTLAVNGVAAWTDLERRAVTDRDGERMSLIVPSRNAAGASLYRAPVEGDGVIEVETVSLDALTRAWPRVDLIKIDAEGAEEAIWRGATETLAHNPAITVIMEVAPARYADPRGFFAAIEGAGFPLRYIDHQSAVQNVSVEDLLAGPEGEWRMLYLNRT